MEPKVLYDARDAIATLTLNRPEKRNALDRELYEQLDQAFDRAEADEAVRVVVLRGNGPSFSSGNDMSQPSSGDLRQWRERLTATSRRTFRIWSFPKPVIAMVQGHCLAGACEFALACDMTVAAEDAKFGEPEIRHGSMAQLLMPWYIGHKKVKELILIGDVIDAREAERIGMVNRVVPNDQLETETYALAVKLAKVPPDAIMLNKRGINFAYEAMGIRSASDYVDEISTMLHVLMFNVKDEEGQDLQRIKYEQGMKAFLKAREARFGSG
ncbi:MAG: enoyl-CoA hydratase/isomerase family protein [Chloroflexota bacterium]